MVKIRREFERKRNCLKRDSGEENRCSHTRSSHFEKIPKIREKIEKENLEAQKIPKNSKENFVKFLAPNRFSRYIL